jgi:hypothetical protein
MTGRNIMATRAYRAIGALFAIALLTGSADAKTFR